MNMEIGDDKRIVGILLVSATWNFAADRMALPDCWVALAATEVFAMVVKNQVFKPTIETGTRARCGAPLCFKPSAYYHKIERIWYRCATHKCDDCRPLASKKR